METMEITEAKKKNRQICRGECRSCKEEGMVCQPNHVVIQGKRRCWHREKKSLLSSANEKAGSTSFGVFYRWLKAYQHQYVPWHPLEEQSTNSRSAVYLQSWFLRATAFFFQGFQFILYRSNLGTPAHLSRCAVCNAWLFCITGSFGGICCLCRVLLAGKTDNQWAPTS